MQSQWPSLENTPAAQYFRDQARRELQSRIEKLEAEVRLSNIIADIRAIEGQIQPFKRFLEKGRITRDEYNEEVGPLEVELVALRKRLEEAGQNHA